MFKTIISLSNKLHLIMITVHYHILNPQDVHLKEFQLQCTTRSRAAKDVNRNIRKHSRSLIIIFLGHILDSQGCKISSCGQQSLCWPYLSEGTLSRIATDVCKKLEANKTFGPDLHVSEQRRENRVLITFCQISLPMRISGSLARSHLVLWPNLPLGPLT